MKYADLHIHTNLSDSTFSPREVVEAAYKCNLSAIGITDHDSVNGIAPVTKIAKEYNIEVVPGIELSTELNGEEMHILGYYIDYKKEWFLEKLSFLREHRLIRAKTIIEKLNKIGVRITIEEVLNISGKGAVGRMHIAKVLMNKRYISNISDAFARFIGSNAPAYVKKYKITPSEGIDIIRKVNGISVLAHPQTIGKNFHIPTLVEYGLDGIEVYHSDHSAKGTKKYLEIAKQYDLLISGGSDCHGKGKDKILIGTTKIPYDLLENIRNKAKERRSNNSGFVS